VPGGLLGFCVSEPGGRVASRWGVVGEGAGVCADAFAPASSSTALNAPLITRFIVIVSIGPKAPSCLIPKILASTKLLCCKQTPPDQVWLRSINYRGFKKMYIAQALQPETRTDCCLSRDP
jgi:hypothetical protein